MSNHLPNTGMNRERARIFALKITEYEPIKLGARKLDIAPDTMKAIRSHHAPGKRLLKRWAERFGAAFTDFIDGKHDSAELAALQAQRDDIVRRIEALER